MLQLLHLHTLHTILQRQVAVKLVVTHYIGSIAEGTLVTAYSCQCCSVQVVQFALAEDAGELGDVTTLSTYALAFAARTVVQTRQSVLKSLHRLNTVTACFWSYSRYVVDAESQKI